MKLHLKILKLMTYKVFVFKREKCFINLLQKLNNPQKHFVTDKKLHVIAG